jgi:transmembrane sensor
MDKERISQLIARKLSGEASPEEIKELDAHLTAHPEDAYFLSILDEYWARPVTPAAEDDEAHFRHILEAAAEEPERQPRILPRVLAVAATVAVLLAGGWWYAQHVRVPAHTSGTTLTESVAKPGAKSRLLLSDGTVVWLNSGSRLNYPSSFNDSIREVTLEGEAYFDVAKAAGKPFIVHTRDIRIHVLGTVFNVKCYPEDNQTEATLISGLVQVSKTGDSSGETMLLHPHEKVVVKKQDEAAPTPKTLILRQLKKNITDTALVETAWVYNKLVFDGEDFRQISNEMERWYNVKVTIHNDAVANYRFHAKFEHETITEVLTALQVSLPFTFKINNNEVDIYK